MALIELRDVGRHYGLGGTEVPALSGVNLVIEAGEFVAIMGQSGSGKSTLMNVLGCLDVPSSGQLLVDGIDVGTLAPDELAALRRERFGFIFQRYHLLPQLDARANAALPAVYAGVASGARRERAEQLLSRLGLGERLHHRPSELSGGQQQRVSIARALMNGGQIILADEPTGALDSHAGAELLALLGELHQRGHTIILVTHDAGVAAHAQRLIELRDGHVLRDSGTPAAQPHAARPAAEDAAPRRGGWWSHLRAQWREALQSALQALLGNRLRSALSMLGICIGIASVVSIVTLTSAVRAKIESDVSGFLQSGIRFWRGNPGLPPGAVPQPFRAAELEAIRAVPGVRGVVFDREMQLTVRQGSRDSNVMLTGTEPHTLGLRKLKVAEGRALSDADRALRAQVALIDENARKALFKPGEAVLGRTLLVVPPGAADGGTALPVRIVGVVVPDGFPSNEWMGRVFVPHDTLAQKLDVRADVDNFSALLDLSVPPDKVRRHIGYQLRAMHGAEDFGSWSGDESFRKIQEVTGSLALLLAGVGAISLLVGGVGVMNIMLVSVSERTREIGIRMAVGARQADVRLQFLVEAVLLCCVGGLAGVALSWLLAQSVNATQSQLHVKVSWSALGVAFGVSSAVGLLFGTLPARRAAALSPVDALARE